MSCCPKGDRSPRAIVQDQYSGLIWRRFKKKVYLRLNHVGPILPGCKNMTMKNLLLISLTFCCLFVCGQAPVEVLFQKADSAYFDEKDYPRALSLYRQIEKQIDPSSKDWKYLSNKIARSLFFVEGSQRR